MLQRAFSKLMRIPPLVWSVAVGLSAVVVFTTFTVAVLSRNHTVGAAGIKKYGRICTACMKGSIGQKSQIREVHPDAGRCGCIQSH